MDAAFCVLDVLKCVVGLFQSGFFFGQSQVGKGRLCIKAMSKDNWKARRKIRINGLIKHFCLFPKARLFMLTRLIESFKIPFVNPLSRYYGSISIFFMCNKFNQRKRCRPILGNGIYLSFVC